jgi:hypothetical protein
LRSEKNRKETTMLKYMAVYVVEKGKPLVQPAQ